MATSKKWLPYVLIAGGGSWLAAGIIGFVIIVAPILFILSPFQSGPPPKAGAKAITQTYLPLEQAAVARYCHPETAKVPVYDARHQLQGYKTEKTCVGVNVAFVQAIMRQESDGWALAVSDAGALGLMQTTIGKYDLSKNENPFDPKTNIDKGVQFLDALYLQFGGNLPLVAAGYNAGPGVPEEWMTEYGTSDWSQLSQEQAVQTFAKGQTWNYVNAVMGFYQTGVGGTAGVVPH